MNRNEHLKKRRSGWTLVEMICVVSVLVAIMGVVAGFLTATHRFHSATQAQLQFQATVNRLASQFRNDVRDSASAAVEGQALTLAQLGERTVVYRRTDDGIIRDSSDSKRTNTRDGFWLSADWQTAWTRDESFVILTLSAAPHTTRTMLRPIVIKAALGGNLIPTGSP